MPIDPAKVYGVVTNNYVRGGGDGYELFASNATEAYDFGPPLEQVVADYIAKLGGTYTPIPTAGSPTPRLPRRAPAAETTPAAPAAAPAEAPAATRRLLPTAMSAPSTEPAKPAEGAMAAPNAMAAEPVKPAN